MHTVSIVSDGEGGFEVHFRGEYHNDARTMAAALEIALPLAKAHAAKYVAVIVD